MYTPLFHKIKDHILQNDIYTIAFIGDSITSTERIHPNWTEILDYVLKSELQEVITQEVKDGSLSLSIDQFDGQSHDGETITDYIRRIPSWNIRTINLARDGSTSRDRVKYSDKWLSQANEIDMAIVMGLGCNDSDFGVQGDEMIDNFNALFMYLENRKVSDIVFATDIPGAQMPFKHTESYEKVYEIFRHRDYFIDMWKEMTSLAPDELLSFFGMKNDDDTLDMVHPNILGNCFLASVYLKALFGVEFDYKKYHANAVAMDYKFPAY